MKSFIRNAIFTTVQGFVNEFRTYIVAALILCAIATVVALCRRKSFMKYALPGVAMMVLLTTIAPPFGAENHLNRVINGKLWAAFNLEVANRDYTVEATHCEGWCGGSGGWSWVKRHLNQKVATVTLKGKVQFKYDLAKATGQPGQNTNELILTLPPPDYQPVPDLNKSRVQDQVGDLGAWQNLQSVLGSTDAAHVKELALASWATDKMLEHAQKDKELTSFAQAATQKSFTDFFKHLGLSITVKIVFAQPPAVQALR